MELLLNNQELLDLGEGLGGLRIACLAGHCWVTQTGDSRDRILRSGGTMTVDAPGRLIVTAMGPCRLTLVAPRALPVRCALPSESAPGICRSGAQ